MSRKKPDPTYSLSRFIYGIYAYYIDRGVPSQTAKVKMVDGTMETVFSFIKKEKDVSDKMLLAVAKWLSKALSYRGSEITAQIKNKYSQSQSVPEQELLPLREIKQLKDSLDKFANSYTGWSEKDGEK